MTTFTSDLHVFSIDDLTGTYTGTGFLDDPTILDTEGNVVEPYVDKEGDILYAIDSEFGFDLTDFVGADAKILDGDYAEGFAGNIYDEEDNVIGLAVRDAETDIFLSGAPFGTWSLGLGGNSVKASTEHYVTMQSVLSDQAYPGDDGALGPLDDDLKLADLRPTGTEGVFSVGALHDLYVHELSLALQAAIDSADPGLNEVRSDIDFDRDGVNDTYRITKTTEYFDIDSDGDIDEILVGAVDLGNDGGLDVIDSVINGYGGEADLGDLLEPNESSVTYDIAYGQDYSVTLKDDGKLLYRWGEGVKRPNDIRMEVNIALPEEWTADENDNGVADSLEDGSGGFTVMKAELVIVHEITNNPNDQVRPEDYENEAAIGRLPSYYVVEDPDDEGNILWVSPVDSYDGPGDALPSYFVLDESGHIDLGVVGGTAVYDPDGVLVGYRNEDEGGNPIGTVLKNEALAALAEGADLDFSAADLDQGFTAAWYTTTDREPFEWSYDVYPENPYANVFVSFRSPEDAAAEGHFEDSLVSGPRWRLTPNKFGQDLPGLEIPLTPNSEPPFKSDNIKYDTGELTTTTLNLLDWDGESPLASSAGWMTIDPTRLDADGDGLIDEGWSQVNGSLGEGDALPDELILSAVTPNGVVLEQNFFDTAVYVKGDRQDVAKLYDMQLKLEYIASDSVVMGSVQKIEGINHEEMTVAFEGGASFENAVVFATPATLNGLDAVTTQFTSIGATSATLYLEEPDGYAGWHRPEDVTLLTLEEGVWKIGTDALLEVGKTVWAKGETGVFHDVTFTTEFDEAPIVILQVQTDNGSQWEIARLGEVTTTGFTYTLQEAEASDGIHVREIVGWAAIDADAAGGVFDWNGIGAQAFDTGAIVDHEPTPFEFDANVGTVPLISAGVSSYNGRDPATLRLANLSDDGLVAEAQFLVSEETTLDEETWHKPESVTGLAFEEAGLLTGAEYIVDTFEFV